MALKIASSDLLSINLQMCIIMAPLATPTWYLQNTSQQENIRCLTNLNYKRSQAADRPWIIPSWELMATEPCATSHITWQATKILIIYVRKGLCTFWRDTKKHKSWL